MPNPEKIPVNTIDEMEALLAEGVASMSDWEDFIDALTGNGPVWPGYIYPNVSGGVGAPD